LSEKTQGFTGEPILALSSCAKDDEPGAFRAVETLLPANSLSPLVIRFNMLAETSRVQNNDIAVTRGWAAEEIGITYSFSNDKKELTIHPADMQNGWNPDNAYSYAVTLHNAAGGTITETGTFTVGERLKGDIPPLSVKYDLHTLLLSWERLANAEVYDIYLKEKDRGDYVLLASVGDDNDALSTQTFAIFDALERASKPQGLYYVRVIGRNTLTKGDLTVASETEVEYNREFPPITGLHYDTETYMLSWENPAIPDASYSIYAQKEGEQEYIKVCDVDASSDRKIDILRALHGFGFGTYQVKITGNHHSGLTGNIEKATPTTVEYPNLILPPITKVSLKDRTITWEIIDRECPVFYMYVKEAGKEDSEYEITMVIDNESNKTRFDINVARHLSEYTMFSPPRPAGTYIFKVIVYDTWHRWYGSLEDAIPITYEFDGLHTDN
jgi:hypothetical protein